MLEEDLTATSASVLTGAPSVRAPSSGREPDVGTETAHSNSANANTAHSNTVNAVQSSDKELLHQMHLLRREHSRQLRVLKGEQEDFVRRLQAELEKRQDQITALTEELEKLKQVDAVSPDLASELQSLGIRFNIFLKVDPSLYGTWSSSKLEGSDPLLRLPKKDLLSA